MTGKHRWVSVLKKINEQILWQGFGLSIVCLLPVFACAWFFNNLVFLKIGLITISLFIAAKQLKYGFAIISFHYVLILTGFTLLYFSSHYFTPLFIFLCALMALGCIVLTRAGHKLRTFGNYTFIPSVYLACEIQYPLAEQSVLSGYWHFLALTPIAWLTMAVVYYFFHRRWDMMASPAAKSRHIINLNSFGDKGEPLKDWRSPAAAIFLGVFVAAMLAVILQIDRPEWLIWSTASVITTEAVLARSKFMQRFCGAMLGISLGLLLSHFLPQSQLTYSLGVLGIMLTLTSFKNYFIAFSSRCFFITLAAYAISTSTHMELTRVENVVIGGIIGVSSLYIMHYLLIALRKCKPQL